SDDLVTAAGLDGENTELRVFTGGSGTWVNQVTIEGLPLAVGIVNGGGQRAVAVLTDTALSFYTLGESLEDPTLLGQADPSAWGGPGSSFGGTPLGIPTGLAGTAQQTLTATWTF